MNKPQVAILGGGLSGLTCAEQLSEAGFPVVVYEQETVLGGLARSFQMDGQYIPLAYHHLMSPDKFTINYLKKYNFWEKMLWTRSPQSFWYYGKEYLLSRPQHIFSFSPLSLGDKWRLFRFGVYCYFSHDWEKLRQSSCDIWLKNKLGERATKILFENLVGIKFGMPLSSVATDWLVKRLHQSVRNFDRYGAPAAGWQNLINSLAEKIKQKGGRIQTGLRITAIEDGKIKIWDKLKQKDKVENTELVVSSLPAQVLLSLAKFPEEKQNLLNKVGYKPMISAVFASPKLLSKYYWSVFLEPPLCCGGIFNYSVLNPAAGRQGYVYYLFSYVNKEDPLYRLSEEELKSRYLQDLQKIWPDVGCLWMKIFKFPYSQPVFQSKYQNPPIDLDYQNIYLTGVYKEYPNPRTMDSAFSSGRQTAEYLRQKYK